jgi:putative endonuclease
MSTKATGDRGEALAAAYLEGLGYRIFERNYRFERAEVDLVAFEPWPADDGGDLVFVEVKARRSAAFGTGEEAVTEAKQRQLRKAAEAFLYERKLDGAPARFDVVVVDLAAEPPAITHHKYAFGMFF